VPRFDRDGRPVDLGPGRKDAANTLRVLNRWWIDFLELVRQKARAFLPPTRASKAVGLIKRAVTSGIEMDFASGLALERELQQQLFVSDDAKEGISAYVDKRPPAFKGK